MRKAVLFGFLVSSLWLLPKSAAENRVVNPSFEQVQEEYGTLKAWGLPKRPGVSFSLDKQVARTG